MGKAALPAGDLPGGLAGSCARESRTPFCRERRGGASSGDAHRVRDRNLGRHYRVLTCLALFLALCMAWLPQSCHPRDVGRGDLLCKVPLFRRRTRGCRPPRTELQALAGEWEVLPAGPGCVREPPSPHPGCYPLVPAPARPGVSGRGRCGPGRGRRGLTLAGRRTGYKRRGALLRVLSRRWWWWRSSG